MIEYLAELIAPYWGPARLLTSYLVLASAGSVLAALFTLFVLPRVWHTTTKDKGRAHAFGADASVGKPMGVGIYMVTFAAICVLLFSPANGHVYLSMVLLVIASFVGYVDDVKKGGLSELTLGLSDLVLSIVACTIILWGEEHRMWLPFTAEVLVLPFWLAVLIYTPFLWLSINAMNCNDGVDGLSGSLSSATIGALGFMMYAVIGNTENAGYLLVPFNEMGANWAIVSAIFCGAIFGYLWHNAPPSAALMGDAGSRPLGLLIGMLIVAAGNPVLILFSGAFILVNGATGLAKVAMIRVFKIRLLHNIRFPLHDHVRQNLGWSNSQVLVRFLLVHLATLWVLMLLLLKVR